jgi:hypothetical protein
VLAVVGKKITSDLLDSISLDSAVDFYNKNDGEKKEGMDIHFDLEFVKELEGKPTAYSLRQKYTLQLANNEYFLDFFNATDFDKSDNISLLLATLPLNKNIRTEMMKISENKEVGQFLDLSSPNKVIYYMNNLVRKIFLSQKGGELMEGFIRCGKPVEVIKTVIASSKQLSTGAVKCITKGLFFVLNHLLLQYCLALTQIGLQDQARD